MADIEQNLQEIEQERSRLSTAKANLKMAIAGKGVTVADDVKLDQYYTLVNSIQVGEGSSSDLPQLELSDLEIFEGVLVLHGPAQISEITGFDILSIVGIGDLAAENIAYGKTICGITGTFGGSIPGSSGDYVLPDDFMLDIKLAFWNMYSPVQTEIVPFKSGTNNDRVWESDSWRLRYNTDKWSIYYIGLGSEDEQARNSKLSKHGWELINFTTPDDAKSFDFISLEDKDWTYSE